LTFDDHVEPWSREVSCEHERSALVPKANTHRKGAHDRERQEDPSQLFIHPDECIDCGARGPVP